MSRDLLGVTPHKIEQARQRVALVAEYAALPHPTSALAQAYANRLGIKKAQFYVLLRLFREHGTIFPHKKPDPVRQQIRIDPRLDRLIETTIEALGADAPISRIARAVDECSDALGLPRASENAVRARVTRARRHSRGSQAYPPLVVDRSALNLNIKDECGTVAAWLTAVIHAPSGQILSHRLSIGDAGPSEAASALESAMGLYEHPLLPADTLDGAIMLFRDLRPGWDAITSLLADAGFFVVGPRSARVRTGGAFHRLLGDGIARFGFRPRTARYRPTTDGGDGIAFETADELIREAIVPYLPTTCGWVGDERLTTLKDGLRLLIEADPAR